MSCTPTGRWHQLTYVLCALFQCVYVQIITGYTLFVEDEERNADAILTRGDMEAMMVVNMAGRCTGSAALTANKPPTGCDYHSA